MSKLSSKSARLLRAFEKAVREHEMRGAKHLGDWEAYGEAYEVAKTKLREHMKELEDLWVPNKVRKYQNELDSDI